MCMAEVEHGRWESSSSAQIQKGFVLLGDNSNTGVGVEVGEKPLAGM